MTKSSAQDAVARSFEKLLADALDSDNDSDGGSLPSSGEAVLPNSAKAEAAREGKVTIVNPKQQVNGSTFDIVKVADGTGLHGVTFGHVGGAAAITPVKLGDDGVVHEMAVPKVVSLIRTFVAKLGVPSTDADILDLDADDANVNKFVVDGEIIFLSEAVKTYLKNSIKKAETKKLKDAKKVESAKVDTSVEADEPEQQKVESKKEVKADEKPDKPKGMKKVVLKPKPLKAPAKRSAEDSDSDAESDDDTPPKRARITRQITGVKNDEMVTVTITLPYSIFKNGAKPGADARA